MFRAIRLVLQRARLSRKVFLTRHNLITNNWQGKRWQPTIYVQPSNGEKNKQQCRSQ